MSESFEFDGGSVEPNTTEHIRFPVSETYLGDPVEIPVSIINSDKNGPTLFLTAAVHGDELNGIEAVRSVAREWNHNNIKGTLICMPVVNVPAFLTQQRYFPVQDRDLNRAFPGRDNSTSSNMVAKKVWDNFIKPADYGIDFHTSTRGRTNMFHVRADMEDDEVERLAKSFASNVIINTDGSEGTLRREASEEVIPTITVEMGQAHRFERPQIERALNGVRSVFSEYNIYPQDKVDWPGWREIVEGWDEKTWIRANAGGIVELTHSVGDVIKEGETICKISNPFETEKTVIEAPFTGMIIGLLKNPVVYPGNPICHFIEPSNETVEIIENRNI